MRSNHRNDGAAGVLDRAVVLLAAFSADDAELSLAELARRGELAKSTAHRLCQELVRHAMLERTAAGYRLGLRMFEIGQLVPRQRGLRETAAPVLADLHAAIRETIHLAVLDGLDVVYVDILRSSRGPELASRVGGRLPAYATGVGKAMLAHSSKATVAAVIEAGLRPRTPHTVTMPGRLRQELGAIARRGTAYEREESGLGVVCAASPVFGVDGDVVAAISATGRSGKMVLPRIAPAVRTAALLLSRQLGFVR